MVKMSIQEQIEEKIVNAVMKFRVPKAVILGAIAARKLDEELVTRQRILEADQGSISGSVTKYYSHTGCIDVDIYTNEELGGDAIILGYSREL